MKDYMEKKNNFHIPCIKGGYNLIQAVIITRCFHSCLRNLNKTYFKAHIW